jgi:hypothetical protein
MVSNTIPQRTYGTIELVVDPATDVKSIEKVVNIVDMKFRAGKGNLMNKPRALSRAFGGNSAYRKDPQKQIGTGLPFGTGGTAQRSLESRAGSEVKRMNFRPALDCFGCANRKDEKRDAYSRFERCGGAFVISEPSEKEAFEDAREILYVKDVQPVDGTAKPGVKISDQCKKRCHQFN